MLERITRFFKEEVPAYLKHKDKKCIATQIREMTDLWKFYGYIPYQYVKHDLYLRSFTGNVRDFIPPEFVHRYCAQHNAVEAQINVIDKKRFYQVMKAANLPTAEMLATICNNGVVRNLDDSEITIDEFVDILSAFGADSYIVKPYNGGGGVAVFCLDYKNGALTVDGQKITTSEDFHVIFAPYRLDLYVVQPRLRQHQVIANLHNSCVNTVRIDTLIINDHVAHNGAYLKVGTTDSITDNLKTGGALIAIDINTGILSPSGKLFCENTGTVISEHPISKVRFHDLVIPFWPELLEVVEAGALALSPLRCLGWDIAITNEGPVIIEANHDYAADGIQEAAGGLRKTAIGAEILKEFDIIE
jgi:hypothetical protein